ncbi:glucose-6-phosphate isomerase, partial [Campylobacter sp. W0018]|nr:glucose-6-phosphate isomerase [Campylobacter sp. W0018]
MKSLTHLNSYKNLRNHFLNIKDVHMRDLFKEDQNRGIRYFLEIGDLKLDYSKNRINDETLELLFNLVNECSLKEKMVAMFKGEKINTTENRAVLHTALRNKDNHSIMIDDMDIMPNVREVLAKMQKFSDSLRSGAWLGYTNQVITDVVNIGIGGSDLGALMVCEALKNFGHPRLHMHFVSNVDGAQLQGVLDQVHPETTLFIVASKTFSTQETLTNAFTARKWFLNHALDEKHIAKHFVAVS